MVGESTHLRNKRLYVKELVVDGEEYQGTVAASVTTTNSTPTTLTTLAVPQGSLLSVVGWVTAKRTGGTSGASGDGALYEMAGLFNNVAGSAAIIAQGQPLTLESQSDMNSAFDVSGANVVIVVTGTDDNTFAWSFLGQAREY